MEKENTLENQEVTVYYDDKTQGIGRKDAVCVQLTSTSIFLRNSLGHLEVIPLHRVIRIIQKDGGD